MTVLVTGGAGYIGSHTVRALRDRGEEVVVLDRLDPGHPAAVPDAVLVRGDVRDEERVVRLIREAGVREIVHFAADKSAPASMTDPGGYFANNLGGSLSLLRAAAATGVRAFVLSSTCAVYGSPARLPVREDAPIQPENPYGESKALVERMLPWFEAAHGVRFASLRYFNAAGAHASGDLGEDWSEATNLIPVVLRAAARGEAVRVFGTDLPTPDGSGIRDYIHVMDLADAHLAALERLRAGGGSLVVNLGTGHGRSVLEVVEAARRITERPIEVRPEPPRPGDPPAVWADPALAARELRWRARLDLDDMLASAWNWHRLHPDGHGSRDGRPGAAERPTARRRASDTPQPARVR